MVDQTEVEAKDSNGRLESAPKATARNMAELMHDFITLGELQYRLLVLDGQQTARRIWHLAIVFAAAVAILASCVPFALVTIALGVATATGISYAAAFGWTLLGAVIVGAALIGGILARLRAGMDLFQRSRIEFSENVRWVKATLRRVSRSNTNPTSAVSDQAHWDQSM